MELELALRVVTRRRFRPFPGVTSPQPAHVGASWILGDCLGRGPLGLPETLVDVVAVLVRAVGVDEFELGSAGTLLQGSLAGAVASRRARPRSLLRARLSRL